MKLAFIFVSGLLLGLGVVAYTIFEPPTSPSTILVIAGPDTNRLMKGDEIRNILFIVAACIAVAAVVSVFLRAKLAAVLWLVVLLITIVRAFLPSSPVPSFRFAGAVFWCGVALQEALCYSAFRMLKSKTAEPVASPNGGPAAPVTNSEVTEGPPSVS